jgi:hypothetical protein
VFAVDLACPPEVELTVPPTPVPHQVDKLVKVFGYPEILRSFTFSVDWVIKGLILDKVRW